MERPEKTLVSNIKTCIITGATSGVGRAAAYQLAKLNVQVVLLGRNIHKGTSIADNIRERYGQGKAQFIQTDLADFKAIRSAAYQIKSQYPQIDILINNAGARFNDFKQNKDGIELTFAINHLGHFLLTHILLDAIKASPAGRIINVSSDAHWRYRADFDYVQENGFYDRKAAYGKSKLANLLFTYELARRLAGTTTTVNAVHPGGVATNLGRNNGIISWLKHYVYYMLKGQLITPAKAAEPIAYLALSDEVQAITGKYFYNKKQIRSSDFSYDKEAQKKLWDMSFQLCGSVT